MGELHRQSSKIWWSSFPGANESDHYNRPWTAALNSSHRTPPIHEEPATHQEAGGNRWDSPDLSRSRGDSSSPSQGSHGSQDSGFSDSELHNGSPELSKRPTSPPRNNLSYKTVEFQECTSSTKGLLETNFSLNASSPCRNQYSTCDNNEKINKIQNQLELSFKLPKKINVKPCLITNELKELEATDGYTSESVRSSCSEHTVIENPKKESYGKRPASDLDPDGFKIPKCVEFRGSCTSLNFSSNPPLSCSTPKGSKTASPKLVRPAKPDEKPKTFATVRKLKGLIRLKPKRSAHVRKVLER